MLRKFIDIFLHAPGGRPLSVVLCMLFASISEMISMGALVPLTSQLSSDGGKSDSYIGKAVLQVVSLTGLEATFTNLLFLVGLTLIMKSVIAFLAMRYVAISVADVTTKLRSKLLGSMMSARWAYFVDHKPGEVASMISLQAGMAGQAYYSVAQLVTTSISGVGLLLTAFLVSGKLVVFCLVATSALAFPLYYMLKIAQESSLQQFQTSSDLTSGVQDVLNNMKPLKSMARATHFLKSFTDSIGLLRRAMILMVVSSHAIYHGQDILGAIMVLAGVYVSVVVLHTPLPEMLVVGIIFYQVVDVIKRVQLHLQSSTTAAAAYNSMMDTIVHADNQLEKDFGKTEPSLEKSIKFENVSFAYGEKTVLNHVNLECPAREITVLIGPSGAGKTTIVDLIIGFYLPMSGRIMIDNTSMVDVQLSKWRERIGYVPQELTLLRGTIADNIKLGDESITAEQVTEALRLAGAMGFVEALPDGINADIGTMGAKLSGGQRQRISLARALVLKPKLLLLDEVTSALDEATEAEICDNIMELSGKFTIVAITHRPAWKRIARHIYMVSDGHVERVESEIRNGKKR
jgi:ATP-binding cassette, subfamily C, bacterial